MNKRIQELIEQTKCLSDGYNTGTVDLQRFAELIVRECSRHIEDNFDFCGDEIIIAESVLKHFGVEE